jgi:flagellin-like protein
MKFGYEHEEAVSPVIGVILMVAITVILAATVGVFVLGMGSDMKGPKEVVIVATTDSTGTTITLQGGKDLTELTRLKIKVDGKAITEDSNALLNGQSATEAAFTDGYLTTGNTFSVGDVIEIKDTTGNLVVTGKFSDGEEKVLLQKNL